MSPDRTLKELAPPVGFDPRLLTTEVVENPKCFIVCLLQRNTTDSQSLEWGYWTKGGIPAVLGLLGPIVSASHRRNSATDSRQTLTESRNCGPSWRRRTKKPEKRSDQAGSTPPFSL